MADQASSTFGSTTGLIYQWPRAAKPGTTPAPVYDELDLSQLATSFDGLRNMVESAVQQMTARSDLLAAVGLPNPFDAVYISQLQADLLDATNRQRLAKHMSINDKSAEITFADGWDD